MPKSTCSPICGDGLLKGSEQCDDQNLTNSDGCSSTCAAEHGWTCVGGGPGSCSTTCGDGLIGAPDEMCDDGDTMDGNGCSSTCQVEAGWTCNGEPSVCQNCGDGMIEGTEQCDDGTGQNGTDGCCKANCTFETGKTMCP